MNLFKSLFDENTFLILKLFLDTPELKINQKEIIKKTKLAKVTVIKILNKILEENILNLEKIGVTNLYTLNNNYFLVWSTKFFPISNFTFINFANLLNFQIFY